MGLLVRSAKAWVRDSGLVHTLLGLVDAEAVLGHPVDRVQLGGLRDRNPAGRGARGL